MLEALAQPRPNHWARVWPTAVALSRWLLLQPLGSLPRAATELGCGVGLVSLTLAHLGLRTEGTDREPLALAFALENATRNGLSGLRTSRLEWADDSGVPTDLLLASDVVYDGAAPGRLFALIDTGALLQPGGRLVLGGPHARTELLDELVLRLCDVGYTHEDTAQLVLWEGRDEPIDVHVLTRPLA
jgi:predicted nicotinamide N-methyase